MAAAQTKGHEEDKHTGMQEKKNEKEEKKNEKRKVGSRAQKARKSYSRISIATNLPVSATTPRGGPCHTICHLLPALVGNGIKCHCCRCRTPPQAKNQRKPNKAAWTLGM